MSEAFRKNSIWKNTEYIFWKRCTLSVLWDIDFGKIKSSEEMNRYREENSQMNVLFILILGVIYLPLGVIWKLVKRYL